MPALIRKPLITRTLMSLKPIHHALSFGTSAKTKKIWVRETRFGRWFLGTSTWYRYVLSQAVIDFKALLGARKYQGARVLDAGCGQGLSFGLLERHFKPTHLMGIDIDKDQIQKAQMAAASLTIPTDVMHGNASDSGLADESLDIIFSHQLLHHTAQQEETLQEFYRILKPGGILLVGESCKNFIDSIPVRLLFRHPQMSQKTAQGYVDLVKATGFLVRDEDVKVSRPWWSKRTLGLAQKIGIGKKNNDPTEILLVATKPPLSVN